MVDVEMHIRSVGREESLIWIAYAQGTVRVPGVL
jgi:hypothetical protein